MLVLVRVDDRLLHGQLLHAWVPSVKADMVIVASDDLGEDFKMAIKEACLGEGIPAIIEGVREAARDAGCDGFRDKRVILIVDSIEDAMRIYEEGLRFTSLNVGSVHHKEENGRMISHSAIFNRKDDEIIERFFGLGVDIDIRDLPSKAPVAYHKRSY